MISLLLIIMFLQFAVIIQLLRERRTLHQLCDEWEEAYEVMTENANEWKRFATELSEDPFPQVHIHVAHGSN